MARKKWRGQTDNTIMNYLLACLERSIFVVIVGTHETFSKTYTKRGMIDDESCTATRMLRFSRGKGLMEERIFTTASFMI